MHGNSIHLHDVLADVFVKEGVDAHFALLGDANMHWATVMAETHKVRTIHARHEHCAAAMACAYAYVTGKVGVASVTHGPGFTQVMTALTTAARGDIPLVVFAGEVPTTAVWTLQEIDQAPFARACGAEYISIKSVKHALDRVREAFAIARHDRRPVVLGIPTDLQRAPFPGSVDYVPSTAIVPEPQHDLPDPAAIARIAELLRAAERPVILAGRGALHAKAELRELAHASGALLATTLASRGLFRKDAYSVGIAGGWSSDVAVELFAQADLVLAFGSSLTGHTTNGGRLWPKARTVQIDLQPRAVRHNRAVAQHHLRADARAAAAALLPHLARDGVRTGLRTPDNARKIAAWTDDATYPIPPGTVDPRLAIAAVNRVVPKDWFVVGGSGHNAYFAGTGMQDRSPELYASNREFGAIGSNIAHAIGIAAARGDRKLLLIDGDGSLLMHIQELETVARHGLTMLIVAMNDGAYGSEVHKLRADGVSDREVVFGRTDFARLAHGFGLRGATVTDLDALPALFEAHMAHDTAEIWDVPISGDVLSLPFKRGL